MHRVTELVKLIHEANRECIWLRSMIQYIRELCGLSSIKGDPTILFEDMLHALHK